METRAGKKTDPPVTSEGAAISDQLAHMLKPRSSNGRGQAPDQAQPYRDLLDAIGVAVYMTDAEGVITYYNKAAAELWGREPEVGKDVWCGSWKIYHLDGVTIMPHGECPMAICLKEGREVRGEEAIAERPDGTRVYFQPHPTPLFDRGGKLTGAINLLVDITERRQAEEALRESESRMSVIVNGIPALVSYVDSTERYVFNNRAYQEWFGHPVAEVSGKTIREVLGPDAYNAVRLHVQSALNGQRVDFETELPYRDGGTRYVHASYIPDTDAEGDVRGFFVIVFDLTDRKRAEQALRDNESRLSIAIEAAQMGSWEWRIADNNVTWSEALERIHGLEPGTFAQTFDAFLADVHPEDRAGVQETIGRSLETGTHEIEYRIVRPDGEMRWVLGKGQLVRDAAGNPSRLVGVCMDITERKQAESATARLAAIVASSDDAIISKDLDSIIRSWNAGAERIFGYTAAEAIGRPGAMLIPEDRFDEEPQILERILRGERIDHYETVRARKDGTLIDISLTISPIRDAEGNIEGSSKIARDITERKRTEQALSDSEARLREERDNLETINRIGTMLSAELDLDRLIQSLTDEATRLVGAEFGAFFYNVTGEKGESYMLYTIAGVPREAFEKFPMPRNTAIFARTFRGEGLVRLDDVRKDPRYGKSPPHHGMPKGHLPVTSYLAAPVVSRSGEVLGGLFFGHEKPGVFSERHEKILEGLAGQTAIALENARLFDQLQKSMAVKDEFLGLVSHELRTPITTILGNSILLERRAEKLPSDVKRDVYRDLTTEAERLERVIENLLLLTRVDVGEQPDMEPLRLQGLISDAIDALQRRSPNRKVVVESDGETPIVLGVPEFVKLVLENLITNADKYSAGDQPIVIITRRDGEEEVEVRVRDFGIGLDEEDVERVFTPFYRADGAKSRAKGIGLGLAVCKRVIEVQGGTIRAIARPEGGCDFVFNLKAYRTTGPDAD